MIQTISAINKENKIDNMLDNYIDMFLTAVGIVIYFYGLKKLLLNQTKSI
tara:strand:+ start:110 stop:259 length:150 start_codon:yes stop_codon:yes gene_type:complete